MERLEELEELARAVKRAAEAIKVLRERAERHTLEGEPPKKQGVVVKLEVGGLSFELTSKQVAALLAVRGEGGVEALNTVTRLLGLNTRLALGLARQLEEKGLVRVVATPQRKIVILTPLGEAVVREAERRLAVLAP